jgi:hypothetical protein
MSPSFTSVTTPPLAYYSREYLFDVTTKRNIGRAIVTIARERAKGASLCEADAPARESDARE